MSVVTLQLGQCGNQLGSKLFDNLSKEAEQSREALSSAIKTSHFRDVAAGERRPWRARAVLLDTEPRVVGACLESRGRRGHHWVYNPTSAMWQQGGAANNWAFGFHRCGPAMEERLLECVHREVEACDRVSAFFALHSVAGGTGSGLGSFALQAVRDAFSGVPIVATCVWPFEGGEVSVQSYNAVLSMAAAYETADMVFLCENERYLDMCKLTLREAHPTLDVVNGAICESLIHALLPCKSPVALGSLQSPLYSLTTQLCSHPAYRLATVRALPQVARGAEAFNSDSWSALQGRMAQLCSAGSVVDRLSSGASSKSGTGAPAPGQRRHFLGAAAFLRGANAGEAQVDSIHRLPFWRNSLEPVRIYTDPHEVAGMERSMGLVSVCQTVLPALEATSKRATEMLRSSAYIHQYERYGVGREEMSEALLSMLQMQHDYSRL